MTKKETNLSDTLSEAVSVATSVAYTRQEIQKLKKELVSLLEEKATEVIVEQVPGPVGPRGSLGATGAQGFKGDKGDVGERGEKGDVGQQGEIGPEGLPGIKGDRGDVGPQGVAGERGLQGLKGDKGDDGKNGLDGKDGQTGEMGPVGPAGQQGIQGEQGLRGDKGDRGERGERGENGQQGIQGPAGLRGEVGPQGIQGIAGKDGKDGDVKPVEEKFKKFQDVLEKDLQQYKNRINASVSKAMATDAWKATGSGEVNLRYLDDVDRDSIQDGYVLSYDESLSKFVFVAQTGGGGGTIDTLARTRANNAFSTANTALSIAQSAFAQANTGGAAGTDNLARSIANSAFSTANASYSQANTANTNASNANTKAQAAYDYANTIVVPSLVGYATEVFVTSQGYLTSANLTPYATTSTTNAISNTVSTVSTTANSAFSQANTATALAQAAYNQANTGGGGVTESLNVAFNNNSATQYKVVALNSNGETILASASNIGQVDKIIGILNNANETVTFGSITNQSWNWITDQSLYLGSNGEIVTTSTIDGGAFSLKLGYAISSTKAFIKIGTPIVL